ncbi:MAG: hypothetical protein V3T31_13480 [candidate division Zixibacteria bacterium]
MSVHNIGRKIAEGLYRHTEVVTAASASTTLTTADWVSGAINIFPRAPATSQTETITIPAASDSVGGITFISNNGAGSVKVYVAAGFGGLTSYDTITIANGDAAMLICDGTDWNPVNATISASS